MSLQNVVKELLLPLDPRAVSQSVIRRPNASSRPKLVRRGRRDDALPSSVYRLRSPSSPRDLYHLTVINLIRFTPHALQPYLIQALARTAYHLSRAKRHAIEQNLNAAFGRLNSQHQAFIVRGTFYSFWQEMFDWSLPPLESIPNITILGMEHLHTALQKGSGVILCESNGFGKRILPKRILHARGFPISQVHGPDNLGGFSTNNNRSASPLQPRIKNFFDQREKQFIAQQFDLPDDESLGFTRTLIHALHHNAILCLAGDGRVSHKFIHLPFLGQTVPFATGMVSLARITAAPILPLFCFRPQNDSIYIAIEPPLDLPTSERDTAARCTLSDYTQRLESRIRAHPEQYRNWHLAGQL
ncbi:MAG TPA: lysophospholipid acyltransferase family protein [Anaerolineae bacterium]|nr:lysophospholipid acyltransferase family protein [Anaerolineae bacterium]